MKLSLLEPVNSSTLFSVRMCQFFQEYFLQLRVFNMEIGSLFYQEPFSAELEKYMYLSKEIHLR
jgi:hypothetical protein